MKNFKLYMALICCFTMLCFPCRAEISPHFDVSTTADSVAIDDTVYLLVNLKDNAGFGATASCLIFLHAATEITLLRNLLPQYPLLYLMKE